MKPSAQKFLLVYSTLVSTAVLCLVLTGAKKTQSAEFDQLRVHRINIVEPDGTLRMVLSNKDQLPPVILKGREHPEMGEPRPQAGMIFYNDEGSENGGLIFGGRKNEKGEVVDSGGSLSFDKYGAGQIVQLAGVDDKDNNFAGLAVNQNGQRIWIGNHPGTASVSLTDGKGHKRIVLEVAADGSSSLAFLDAEGHVVKQLAPKE
jgi:hypothetical protein